MFRRASAVAALFLATTALAACSSGPDYPPPDLAAARAAVDGVDPETVNRYAAVEMREARSYLDQAEAAWRQENAEAAQRYATQALATVRLAEARADAAEARAAESDLQESLQSAPGATGTTTTPGLTGTTGMSTSGTGVDPSTIGTSGTGLTPTPVQPAPVPITPNGR